MIEEIKYICENCGSKNDINRTIKCEKCGTEICDECWVYKDGKFLCDEC